MSEVQASPLGEHLPPSAVFTQMSVGLAQGVVALQEVSITMLTPPLVAPLPPRLRPLPSPPPPSCRPAPPPPGLLWLPSADLFAEQATTTPTAMSSKPRILLDKRRSVIRTSVTR